MQAKNQFSRRQIRIKIFQLLYSAGSELDNGNGGIKKVFLKNMNQTETSFAALSLFILKVFQYSLIYANRNASKFIATNEVIDTDVASIPFIEKLKENASFTQAIKDNVLQHIFPDDLVRATFLHLKETEEYKLFLTDKNNPALIENLILRAAEYAIDTDERASEFFDEKFIHWEDDIEVIQRWLLLLIKQPSKIIFQNTLTAEKLTFAKDLLETYAEKFDFLNSQIAPRLKNWDADRVAVIDLILLRLGLAEILFFNEVPVKVSINEYIDIAKMYSTDQSGQFVNGVLDNIKKDLEKKGELRKSV